MKDLPDFPPAKCLFFSPAVRVVSREERRKQACVCLGHAPARRTRRIYTQWKFLSRARTTWTDWRTPPAAEPGARRCPSTEIGKCDPIFYHQTDARCDLISEIMP